MVVLKEASRKDIWKLMRLRVAQSQRTFVASNLVSFMDARQARRANGVALPFGIYADGVPVGFLMIGYDTDESWTDPPEIAKGNYNLWRLMIDRRYQKRGYGREALRQALAFIRTFPCGEAEYCWLSFAPENDVARRLYRSFGFRETGGKDGDELIAALRLEKKKASGESVSPEEE